MNWQSAIVEWYGSKSHAYSRVGPMQVQTQSSDSSAAKCAQGPRATANTIMIITACEKLGRNRNLTVEADKMEGSTAVPAKGSVGVGTGGHTSRRPSPIACDSVPFKSHLLPTVHSLLPSFACCMIPIPQYRVDSQRQFWSPNHLFGVLLAPIRCEARLILLYSTL